MPTVPTIPPRFLEEIRARVSVSSVVGARVRLIRAGREHKACCPFHHEKTPSFYVNDEKAFYHCFGCGAHGDVIRFLMDHDKMPFLEAVAALAAQAGLEVPKASPAEVKRERAQRTLYDALAEAAAFFRGHLRGPPLDYLRARGLSEEAIGAFGLGYAPADGGALVAHLEAQGFARAQVVEAGLARPSTRGGGLYAFFRDRVTFPVTDARGRIVAFGARALSDSGPKYINSPDSPVFDKSRALFALREAKAGARAGHTPLIVEGYMDALACHAGGFRGAVAPMGTALTAEQLGLIWRISDAAPVLALDGDEAGRRAALRAVERALPLLAPGRTLRIALLPAGEDPDSLIRRAGPGALRRALEGAAPLVDFLWQVHVAQRRTDTPESRAAAQKSLMDAIGTIADREVAGHYRAAARERISAAFFPRSGRKRPPGAGILPRPVAPLLVKTQQALLAGVLNHPHIYPQVEEVLGRMAVADAGLDALRCALIAALEADTGIGPDALAANLRVEGHAKVMDDMDSTSVYIRAPFAAPGSDPSVVAPLWLERAAEMEAKQEQRVRAHGSRNTG
jgi:DNA primase